MADNRHRLPGLAPEMLGYYAGGQEESRLEQGPFRLERARTEELLLRWLPAPPARILDVGGGAGAYACWLAARGYEVELVDPVPLHVEQAARACAGHPARAIARARVGDARALEHADGSQDAVLLLGPLYHLTDRAERVRALAEARRVARPGGPVFAAAISRFASLLDGLVRGFLDDPAFAAIVERDLADGQHRNPGGRPEYFTTAFFHRPEDLRAEVEEAGLVVDALVGVEGPGWLLPDFDRRWADDRWRRLMLQAARGVEHEPSAACLSAHLLAVARRPERGP